MRGLRLVHIAAQSLSFPTWRVREGLSATQGSSRLCGGSKAPTPPLCLVLGVVVPDSVNVVAGVLGAPVLGVSMHRPCLVSGEQGVPGHFVALGS